MPSVIRHTGLDNGGFIVNRIGFKKKYVDNPESEVCTNPKGRFHADKILNREVLRDYSDPPESLRIYLANQQDI